MAKLLINKIQLKRKNTRPVPAWCILVSRFTLFEIHLLVFFCDKNAPCFVWCGNYIATCTFFSLMFIGTSIKPGSGLVRQLLCRRLISIYICLRLSAPSIVSLCVCVCVFVSKDKIPISLNSSYIAASALCVDNIINYGIKKQIFVRFSMSCVIHVQIHRLYMKYSNKCMAHIHKQSTIRQWRFHFLFFHKFNFIRLHLHTQAQAHANNFNSFLSTSHIKLI